MIASFDFYLVYPCCSKMPRSNFYFHEIHFNFCRAKSIGVWFKVLTAMMVLSMATNCFLIGFSSEQLATWVPEMYYLDNTGDQWIKPGFGR